jgi:non-specific serine/threonine protein kinase
VDKAMHAESPAAAPTPFRLRAVPRERTPRDVVAPVAPGNLPRPLTRLIGREADVAAARAMLVEEGVRLLTLTGPGGVGKSRLALCVAEAAAEAFADGVVFVPLAGISDPALVPHAIARALEVRESAERSLAETLVAALRSRRLLLVLDNVEHLVGAGNDLAQLLQACPGLTMLVTSRAPLQLSGERRFATLPLTLPVSSEQPAEDALAASAAMDLFVDRARWVQPRFTLSERNVDAIGEICRCLDGLPLAIELAAAWVRVLPPALLRDRLEPRLPLLQGGTADQPARLRSMREAIAWSYDLLSEEEARLFRRLAVFVGGFTLDAAESVGGDAAFPPERVSPSVLDLLAGLIDKSLVQLETDGAESRFALLETVREYALERLAESGEAAAVGRRHATAVVALCERAAQELPGPDERAWAVRLGAELGNIRAALAWGLAQDVAVSLQIGAALWHFWYLSGLMAEGRNWLEAALARADAAPVAIRAPAAVTAAALALIFGDFAGGIPLAKAALALSREVGDPLGEARALWVAGYGLGFAGNAEEGEQALVASLCRFAESTATATVADRAWASRAQCDLGFITFWHGDRERGMALCEAGIAQGRAAGSPTVLRFELLELADLLLQRDDPTDRPRARAVLEECLNLAWNYDAGWLLACPLCALADLQVAEGDPEQAIRLIGAADAVVDAHAFDLLPPTRVQMARALARAEAALGPETVAAARAAGRDQPTAEAIALALREPLAPDRAADAAVGIDEKEAGARAFSPRQREVLALMVGGRSDRQIAEALFISHRTASHHVAAIMAKLDARTRGEAAVRAVRDGLI